ASGKGTTSAIGYRRLGRLQRRDQLGQLIGLDADSFFGRHHHPSWAAELAIDADVDQIEALEVGAGDADLFGGVLSEAGERRRGFDGHASPVVFSASAAFRALNSARSSAVVARQTLTAPPKAPLPRSPVLTIRPMAFSSDKRGRVRYQ